MLAVDGTDLMNAEIKHKLNNNVKKQQKLTTVYLHTWLYVERAGVLFWERKDEERVLLNSSLHQRCSTDTWTQYNTIKTVGKMPVESERVVMLVITGTSTEAQYF